MGARYQFEDVWTIPCSVDVAWRMVDDVAGWPGWWPDYRRVERVSADVEHGVGVRWRVGVKANLPYTVDFTFTVLDHDPPRYVRTRVEGFFDGTVDWRLEADRAGTRVVLLEETETRWPLINLIARVGGRRLLEANHRAAMRRGEEGMRAALAAGYSPPALDG
jgi:Polyketide cyclase / dehydrase and lipid transport